MSNRDWVNISEFTEDLLKNKVIIEFKEENDSDIHRIIFNLDYDDIEFNYDRIRFRYKFFRIIP